MPSLYVTVPGTRIELETGQLICIREQEIVSAVPVGRVDRVIIVGGCNVTTPVLAYLLDHDIDLVFLTAAGVFRGRLQTTDHNNMKRRRLQYERAADDSFRLELAKTIVHGKLWNCRTRCMELDQHEDPISRRAIDQLKMTMQGVWNVESLADLMGIEGRGTRWYFSEMRRYLREPWEFTSRKRHPPPDPVNALLSLSYTLLHENCRSALEVVGLDPACGFLHRPKSGHASLASDLMEEFRPVIADTVVWSVLNKKMLTPSDFAPSDRGGIQLTPEGWRIFAKKYNRRMETRIRVPDRKTQTTYRKLLEIQARQLVRVIEGDQDAYRPFEAR